MVLAYVAPDVLLRMILTEDADCAKMLLIAQKEHSKRSEPTLITSDFAMWEVLCCLSADEIKERAVRISEVLRVFPVTNPVCGALITMAPERKNKLRGIALI